jgi:hypothetical protein
MPISAGEGSRLAIRLRAGDRAARHDRLIGRRCANPSSRSPARSGTTHPVLRLGTLFQSSFPAFRRARVRRPTKVLGRKQPQLPDTRVPGRRPGTDAPDLARVCPPTLRRPCPDIGETTAGLPRPSIRHRPRQDPAARNSTRPTCSGPPHRLITIAEIWRTGRSHWTGIRRSPSTPHLTTRPGHNWSRNQDLLVVRLSTCGLEMSSHGFHWLDSSTVVEFAEVPFSAVFVRSETGLSISESVCTSGDGPGLQNQGRLVHPAR